MTIVDWKLYRKVKVCAYLDYVFMSGYIPSIRENEEWQFGHQCNATKWSLWHICYSNHKWIIRLWSALNAFRSIICHCWWVKELVNNHLRWIIEYKIAYNGLQLSLSSWFYKNDILTLACLTYFLIKIY